MKPYKYLPHTADTKFQAYGKTIEEAFSNAALAVANIMVDTAGVSDYVHHTLTVKATDWESLLQQFLEEFLILLDSEHFVMQSVRKIKITKLQKAIKLDAVVDGDEVSKYETHGPQVKAITYHDMQIKRTRGKCMVQVVVDI